MTAPNTTSTIPVALLRVFGDALLANTAAILAQRNVNTTHSVKTTQSGGPLMAKWEHAPVNAVNAIIKTLVPTAVFNSYPSTVVKINNIIIPPPAPTNPQIKPIRMPHTTDCTARFFAETSCMASFVVITGLTMNLIPNKKVINTEKFPMVAGGMRLAT